MRAGVVVLVVLVGCWIESGETRLNNRRKDKFLSLFSVGSVENNPCTDETSRKGICYLENECSTLGGNTSSTCANGFGVCCIFKANTCNSTVTRDITYILNPNEDGGYNMEGSCEYKIEMGSEMCQVRLDIVEFVLASPDTTSADLKVKSTCNVDSLVVSGYMGASVPTVCGTGMDGQHMYVHAMEGKDVNLVFMTKGNSLKRKWKIRATKIPCSSHNELVSAPSGCLQYFTERTGEVKSFAFDDVTRTQLSNQQYTVCVKQHNNFCHIKWQTCPGSANAFTVSNTATCDKNYVIIIKGQHAVDRFCGRRFPEFGLTSSVTPFYLIYHTDNQGDDTLRGFCLRYEQRLC